MHPSIKRSIGLALLAVAAVQPPLCGVLYDLEMVLTLTSLALSVGAILHSALAAVAAATALGAKKLQCKLVIRTPPSKANPKALGACIAAAKHATPTTRSQWRITQRFNSQAQLCCAASCAFNAA
jgi:hypothetical protein